MKPLHKKIWTAFDHCSALADKNIGGLRGLFDPRDAFYANTTRLEKIKILSRIKEECGCTIDDIFQAFYTYYASMENYDHVLKDSLDGLARLTPYSQQTKSMAKDNFPTLEAAFKNGCSESENEDRCPHLMRVLEVTLKKIEADCIQAKEPLIRYLSENVWMKIYSSHMFYQERQLFLDYTALFTGYLDKTLPELLADPRTGKSTPAKKSPLKRPPR